MVASLHPADCGYRQGQPPHHAPYPTLYANGSGGLLERMAATGVDVVGLDWTIDMADARKRVGSASVQVCCVCQVMGDGLR